ncbi:tRNA pseudouridine(55) synthase TruB [Thermodesulfobacterium hydrogeniphilum]|uniref:tRNA pseudouridine(55) synthase TruB n=1 Tax=Thermodesulfobacterium hydrogeniphilum TaxID=161156 RepID=UPI00068E9CB3|nr:tRNA pseudouridine(55) synthase TruB [Thermodesulfobacterium hydrogeniphilum]
MQKNKQLNGILVIDKPKGLTSTEALEEVKKILKVKKAGHGGTLDPIATGVLPVFLGKATKVAQIFLEGDKVYKGEFQLGITTLTYDITGEVVAKYNVPDISVEDLQKIANTFIGEIEQVPPPFSAAKYRGRPLYKYARDGLLIPKEPKKIKIYEFKILEKKDNFVKFYLSCSKGTYVRALIHNLGEKLECGAVLSSLRRVKKSVFSIEKAITLEDLKSILKEDPKKIQNYIISIEKALEFLPKIIVSEEFSQRVKEGRQMHTTSFLSFIKFQKLTLSPTEKWIRIVNTKGKLVAIIENPLLNPSSPYVKYFRVFKDN